jgi:hypothetical protein
MPLSGRVRRRGNSQIAGISFPEGAGDRIRERLDEVAEHVPALGTQHRFDRHAGQELEAGGGEGLVRDFDHRLVIGGAGGLIDDGVGRDGDDAAVELGCFVLVEGAEPQDGGLSEADLVDVDRADADRSRNFGLASASAG